MKKILAATFLTAVVILPAYARPSSSSSFSRSYSRPSSSYSYSASRSYSAPSASRSYSAPTYSAPSRSYSSSSNTTVIHNHSGGSGGGFGSSFLGGMAGSVVGNALMDHHDSDGGRYIQPAPPPAIEGPPADTTVRTPSYTQTYQSVEYSHSTPIWPWVLGAGIIASSLYIFRRRNKSVYTKQSTGVTGFLKKRKALFPKNPDLIVGCKVDVPGHLGDDTGNLTFVMDNVGKQESTAIGKNDAYAHLYLGGEIDEDFVRVFLSSPEGGKPREAWAFSNVSNNYGSDVQRFDSPSVTIDGKNWSQVTPPISDVETIITEDGEETERHYNESIFSRVIAGGKEFLLIRNISWSDASGHYHRAQRIFAGVSIPISSVL